MVICPTAAIEQALGTKLDGGEEREMERREREMERRKTEFERAREQTWQAC